MKPDKVLLISGIFIIGLIVYFTVIQKKKEEYVQLQMQGAIGEEKSFWDWLSDEWTGYWDNYLSQGKIGRFGF